MIHVFQNPEQVILAANICYSAALCILGLVVGHWFGKRAGKDEGRREGQLIRKKREGEL